MKLSDKQKQFIKLYSTGYTLQQISKMIKTSTKTLVSWKKAFSPRMSVIDVNEFAKIKEELLSSRSDRVSFLLLHFGKIRLAIDDVSHTFRNYDTLLALSLKILHELERYEALFVPDENMDLPFIDDDDSDMDTGNLDEEINQHLNKN